jgi:hypothetical protein
MPTFAVKIPGDYDIIKIEAEEIAYDEYNLELTSDDRVVAYFREWSYVYELPEEEVEDEVEDEADSAEVVEVSELADVVVRSALDSR